MVGLLVVPPKLTIIEPCLTYAKHHHHSKFDLLTSTPEKAGNCSKSLRERPSPLGVLDLTLGSIIAHGSFQYSWALAWKQIIMFTGLPNLAHIVV